ncbi:MAG TPA: lipopolysaccharide biosynthesis protein, partial [Polyangiaceae bacterium]|nr:lipopolysaccharide biosynthesis protein [Polyangiaceae bacterium]
AFGLVVVLCFVRVRGGPFGEELLLRTATATTAGLLLATLAAGVLVKKSAGAVLAPATALRVGLAMAVAIAVARQLPASSKPMTVVFSAVIGAIYVALLLVTRELGRADLDSVKAVVSRRRGA